MLLWLIGMMGTGKTRVGALVAERLGIPLIDTDQSIVERTGLSIETIFSKQGEQVFRQLETTEIESLIGTQAVVATGGGVVTNPANVDLIRSSGRVIWLRAEPATLADRLGHGDGRPLLAGVESLADRLATLAAEREPLYRQAAHVLVDTDHRLLEEVADEVVRLWTGS